MRRTNRATFFRAIDTGDVRILRKMLAREPSLLHENENGFTPLMRAVSSMERTPRLVKTLVSEAFMKPLLATDAYGQTVLEYAHQCLVDAAQENADRNAIKDDVSDASLKDTFAQANEFDYAALVRESIRLIESALKSTK